jgi:uncharacterized protein YqjF (DUF2071 family)
MHHRWESLLFLHWHVSPERIQRTLPTTLTVDRFRGEAFLGITPFFMRHIRPVGLPAIPWLSNFQELNVRTYVYDSSGIPGIWFYSLDCDQPLAVAGARALTGLPYVSAEMDSTGGPFIQYSCRRQGVSDAAEYRYRGVGEARKAEEDSLEFFLLERYYLYAVRNGGLLRAQVSHHPYEFREAEVLDSSVAPAHWDGFTEVAGAPVHSCFADGLDVKVFGTRKLPEGQAQDRRESSTAGVQLQWS